MNLPGSCFKCNVFRFDVCNSAPVLWTHRFVDEYGLWSMSVVRSNRPVNRITTRAYKLSCDIFTLPMQTQVTQLSVSSLIVFVFVFFFAENLTVKSLDFSIRLSIFAEESHRYLCFNNKWSLVGSVSVWLL